MLKRLLALLAVVGALAAASPSQAQYIIVTSCGTVPAAISTLAAGKQSGPFMDVNGNACTAASVSASITGFNPTTTGTPIAVTTGGVSGTLPAGAVVVATNVGTTNAAYCKLGASATTSDQYIAPAGGWFQFTVAASTQLTCITSTSTTTVNMVGGSGLPTGTGGGGGGSGGGGAVTIADGASVTLGAKADAKSTATDGTAITAMSVWKQISASVQAMASSLAGTLTVNTHGVTIADGSNTNQGANADAAITTNTTGTLSGKLRGVVAILADVWDSTNHRLHVNVDNATTTGRAVSGSSSPVVPSAAPTTWHLIAANSTNATIVKGSAATLFSCQLGNNSANIGYLKIYNKATAPTVGTDTPVKTLIIPGPTAGGGGSNVSFGPGGLTLGTGFAAAITGVITDADTTAVAATAFAINCDYE